MNIQQCNKCGKACSIFTRFSGGPYKFSSTEEIKVKHCEVMIGTFLIKTAPNEEYIIGSPLNTHNFTTIKEVLAFLLEQELNLEDYLRIFKINKQLYD